MFRTTFFSTIFQLLLLLLFAYSYSLESYSSRQDNFSSSRIYPDEKEEIVRSKQEFLDLQTWPILKPLCEEPDVNNILFMLHTREFPNTYVIRLSDLSRLEKSTYNIHKPLKVIVHGLGQNGETFAEKIIDAYLKKEDVNVVSVDWSRYSTCLPTYVYRKVLPVVGDALARMLRVLYDYGANPAHTHIIGHSFGADIAGIANQNLTGQEAPFILGLDPAGVFTYFDLPTRRLYFGDAYFVVAIHTNMGIDGMAGQIGQADFYPNGGTFQPGCDKFDLICSHERSVSYFIESILSEEGFYGIKCISYKSYLAGFCASNRQIIMGEDTPKNARGKFYLKTNASPSFARGKQRPI